jgi:hypothetical protein
MRDIQLQHEWHVCNTNTISTVTQDELSVTCVHNSFRTDYSYVKYSSFVLYWVHICTKYCMYLNILNFNIMCRFYDFHF